MIPRYSRPEMADIWSPETKFRIWFEIEAHAADKQVELGVIPKEAAAKVWERGAKAEFNVERIDEIEREVKHDVIAFLTHLAEIVGPEAALDMVQRLPGAIVAAQFRKKKQPRAAADEGGPERITAPANDAPASATGAEPCRAAAAPAGAAPDAKSVALQEQWLQYQIQAAVKAALPGAIERFFENGLLQNPQEDIFPEIRNRLGDSLHHYLATQLEQGLGQEVRNEIMADIIGADRSKAYEEFKSRHQNQFERELFFNMLVARKEHEKLVDLMGDLVKLLKLIESYDNSSKLISNLLDLACELR